MDKPVCAISKNPDIKKAVFEVLSKIDLPDLNGKNVLLKPNVGRNVKKNLGINTSPTVTNAIFQYLKKRFDANFFIGDSPIIGVNSKEAFLSSGYGFLISKNDISFIDMDSKEPVILEIKNGRLLKKIKVTGFIHNFDYIVSIPVLKMHMHTGASLSFKNMKGLIYKREKVKLHQLYATEEIRRGYKELDIAIADLANVIEPHLAVIDAYYAQEGMGPSAGTRKKLSTIIASTNFLAADIVALSIVKLKIEHVPHLELISEQKSGVYSIDEIKTIPADIEPFKTDFEILPVEITIKDKRVNLIDIGSCSSCQSSICLFVKNNKRLIHNYFKEYGQLNIAVGKKIDDVPNDSIIIGNCAMHQKQKGIFIKGCPPSQTIIKEILERELSKNNNN